MDSIEFERKVMEMVTRWDEVVPSPLRVGHMKKSDTNYEIAVVDPFGQPIMVNTVYIDSFGDVCYCMGQQYSTGEKAVN